VDRFLFFLQDRSQDRRLACLRPRPDVVRHEAAMAKFTCPLKNACPPAAEASPLAQANTAVGAATGFRLPEVHFRL